MTLFKITHKEMKSISPNVLLTMLNIPWTIIDADINTIEEDIIKSLIIQNSLGILQDRNKTIDFNSKNELNKLVTFYIADSSRCLCCTILSYIKDVDDLIKMMTRCASLKAFL